MDYSQIAMASGIRYSDRERYVNFMRIMFPEYEANSVWQDYAKEWAEIFKRGQEYLHVKGKELYALKKIDEKERR